MSTPPEPPEQATPPPEHGRPSTLAFQNTPNAEKYVLEADAMRRRQMRSALLHGSRRTWRDYGRIWPAVVIGIIVVAVIIAGMAVVRAYDKSKDDQKKKERELERSGSSSAPRTPGPTPTSSPGSGSSASE